MGRVKSFLHGRSVSVTEGIAATAANYALIKPSPTTQVIAHLDLNAGTAAGIPDLVSGTSLVPSEWPAGAAAGGYYVPTANPVAAVSVTLPASTTCEAGDTVVLLSRVLPKLATVCTLTVGLGASGSLGAGSTYTLVSKAAGELLFDANSEGASSVDPYAAAIWSRPGAGVAVADAQVTVYTGSGAVAITWDADTLSADDDNATEYGDMAITKMYPMSSTTANGNSYGEQICLLFKAADKVQAAQDAYVQAVVLWYMAAWTAGETNVICPYLFGDLG